MAEKSWFEQLKEAASAAGGAGEEAMGAIGGLPFGMAKEGLSYVRGIPSSVKELATHPIQTFKEFETGMKQIREGTLDITKTPDWEETYRTGQPAYKSQGGGKERVIQGLFGKGGPRGFVDKEGKLKSSPFYDASKRDLLNIGEGLVDLVGLASGVGGTESKEAAAEEYRKKYGKEPTGIERGFFAGKKTGEEMIGGFIIPGIILEQGLRGEEGKKLYREAPVTYAMNALPIISTLIKGIKAGTISKVRAAEIESAVKRSGFNSLEELESAIKQSTEQFDQNRLGETLKKSVSEGLKEAEQPKYGFKEGTAPISRAIRGGATIAEKALEAAPLVSAGYSLGGVAGAALVGGIKATPLLAKFLPPAAAAPIRKRLSKIQRAVGEPRTYETPQAAEVGEELRRVEGETAVIASKLKPLINVAQQVEIEAGNWDDARISSEYQASLKAEQNYQQQLNDVKGHPQLLDMEQALEEAIRREKEKQTRLVQRINEQKAPSDNLSSAEVEHLGSSVSQQPLKIAQINKNRQLRKQFNEGLNGTELENLPQNDKENLFKALVFGSKTPVTWLVDDSLRNGVVSEIEQRIGQKLSSEAKEIVDNALFDASYQASRNVRQVPTGKDRKTLGAAIGHPEATLLDLPVDNILKPAAEHLTSGGSLLTKDTPTGKAVIVNADLPSLSRIVEDVAKKSGFNPSEAIIRRELETAQKGIRKAAVTPYLSEIANETPEVQHKMIEERFTSGEPIELPTAINFEPSGLISILKEEAANTSNPALRGNVEYKKYVLDLANRLEELKPTATTIKSEQGAGAQHAKLRREHPVRMMPSAAEQDVPNKYDATLNLIEGKEATTIGTGLQVLKKLSTLYNPMVGLGNYLGNAFVKAMATGNPLPSSLIADRLYRLVKTKTAQMALEDELVLRAVPTQDILSSVEGGNLLNIEKNKPLALWRKAYDMGDTIFKLDEATRQSKNLLTRLGEMKDKAFDTLLAGPDMQVVVQKNGNNFTFINPETGNILTSGTLESPAVKRILGSAVKHAVDNLYPDVREMSSYFAKLAQGRGGTASKLASAVVFAPFMSYAIKAADTPWKRGILSTVLELPSDSPLLGTGKLAEMPSKKIVATQAARYFGSRGLVNSIAARYNNLSAEERDSLRKMYAFTPSEVKPVVFGNLVELSNGETVRKTFSPSFANFWNFTDDTLRGYAWLADNVNKLFSKDISTDDPNYYNDFVKKVMEGKGTTSSDALKAAGVGGGLLLPLYRKALDSEQLGKSDVTAKDVLKPFGIVGKGLIAAGEYAGTFDEATPFNRPLRHAAFQKIADVLIGSQLSREQQPEKAAFFLSNVYKEYWNNLIKPLADEANIKEAEGDYSQAEVLRDEANQLNEDLKGIINMRAETFNSAFELLGLGKGITTKNIKFNKVKEKEVPVEVEQPPVVEEQPTEEGKE